MSSSKKPPETKHPAGRAAPRFDEVLDVAVEVFRERGYDGATIQQIADRLNMLKGSLYYYIRTKEDLLFAIVESIHEDSREIVERATAQDAPPLERLAQYIREQVGFMLSNVARFTVYYNDAARLSEEHLHLVRERRARHERFLHDVIVEARDAGQLNTSSPPQLAVQSVLGIINWPHRWWPLQRSVGVEDVAEDCVRFALAGLGAAVEAPVE